MGSTGGPDRRHAACADAAATHSTRLDVTPAVGPRLMSLIERAEEDSVEARSADAEGVPRSEDPAGAMIDDPRHDEEEWSCRRRA